MLLERPSELQKVLAVVAGAVPVSQDSSMSQNTQRSTAGRAVWAAYPALAPFPFAFFAAALVTDIAYWQTAEMQWSNFSVWLITAGLVMSGVAALAGVFDLLANLRTRGAKPAWLPVIGNLIAIGLALVDAFVHSRDAYTSVVPTGLILSALVVLILLVTRWLGSALVYRFGAGVTL